MASALFKLSSDGGSTYADPGVALADSEALTYNASGTYSIKAALDSTAGVGTASWSITSADDVNIASLPTVTQNASDKTCTFSVTKTGGAWLLQCIVNGGINLATGKADPALTRSLAIKVLNSAGQQEVAVGESTEAGAYGWTKAHNDVARSSGGGGGVIAGAGLTLTGSTLDVVAADSTLQVNANSIQANPSNIVTASTVTTALAALSSSVSVNSQRITSVANPSSAQDAATKGYVDGLLTTLDLKASVRVATTTSITLSGEQTIDGVSAVAGDRVLVKDLETLQDNGIYVVAAGSWSRATDADSSAEVTSGMFCFVEEGTTHGGTGWLLTTANPITLGSTGLAFQKFTNTALTESGFRALASTLTADLDINTQKITNVADPTSAQHAATKAYVDSAVGGPYVPTSRAVNVGDGLTGGGALSGDLTLDCNWSEVTPSPVAATGAPGNSPTVSYSNHIHAAEDVTARTAASALTGAEVLGLSQSAALRKTGLAAMLALALVFQLFGSGADGDVTVTGTVSLSRDMFYNNLTINGSGSIRTNGYRVFVSDTLDITAAAADAIYARSSSPNGSAGATAGTGGTGGAAVTNGTAGGSSSASVGGAGGTAAGVQAGPGSAGHAGGSSGTSGAGGSGSGGAGGAARSGVATSGHIPGLLQPIQTLTSSTMLLGGSGGCGGSGGGGDGTSGAGGGGGGGAGAALILFARRINRGASTAASAITAKGGNGGAGGSAAAGNRGGGGGGSGGGGGFVTLCFAELLGSTATNAVGASGGDGGNGGNGFGTGTGGNGGDGGSSGRLVIWDLSTWTVTDTPGSAGAAGSAASGTTGGNGGAGHSLRANL